MKPAFKVVILALIALATFLVVYFGIIKKGKDKEDKSRVDNEEVPMSKFKPKLRFADHEIKYDHKTEYNHDHKTVYNHDHLKLTNFEGTYVESKYSLKVRKEDIDSLPGYEKYIYETTIPFTTSSLNLGYVKIPIDEIKFVGGKAYYWHNEPLLLIINTEPIGSDSNEKSTLYFVRVQAKVSKLERYEPEVDFKDNEEKIKEFIKKLNVELHNVFPLDIGMIMDNDEKVIHFNEIDKRIKYRKKGDQFSPFNKITMFVLDEFGMIDFQISNFTYKGHIVDLIAPAETIRKAAIYSWNDKPLLIELMRYPGNYHYYRQTDSLEWSAMIDKEKRYNNNRELSSLELNEILETINNELNNASIINLSKYEDYEYKKKEIFVEQEEIEINDIIYVKYTYKMINKENQFIIGGYEYNSAYYRELPVGIKLKELSVYTLNELPLMLEIEIMKVEEENISSGEDESDGDKTQTQNRVQERYKEYKRNKRYFFFNEKSKWEEIEIEGSIVDVEDKIVEKLYRISRYLGEIIILDVSKKEDYGVENRSEAGDQKQLKMITVNFKEKAGSLFIYTQKPPIRDSNFSERKSSVNGQATIAKVVYKDKNIVGILPTTVTQAEVYMTEDDMPVGINIYTGFERKGYKNTGMHIWKDAGYNGTKLDLETESYYMYSRKFNNLVELDIGNMDSKISQDISALLNHWELNNTITYIYRLYIIQDFILDGLRYKGVKYTNFDVSGLFSLKIDAIKVFYTRDSFIPVIFVLYKYFREVSYYNDFNGNWIRLSLYYDEYYKHLDAFEKIDSTIKGVISIDNYADYSSEFKTNEITEFKNKPKVDHQLKEGGIVEVPNPDDDENNEESMVRVKKEGRRYSKVDIKVEKCVFMNEYTKCKHSLTALTNPVGIIYMGFMLKGLPNFKQMESLTVIFKKNIHIPLFIEVVASNTLYQFVNRGNDVWEQVAYDKETIDYIREAENVLSETDMWKTTEIIKDDKMNLDLREKEG